MALLTALWLKAGLTTGDWNPRAPGGRDRPELFDFAFLVTVLLFARSGLYSSRGERPGMTRIVSSLFQVAVVALVFACRRATPPVRLVLHLLRLAVLRRHLRVAAAARLREVHRRAAAAAGYQRRAVLVGSGEHIEAVGPRAARRRDADASTSSASSR